MVWLIDPKMSSPITEQELTEARQIWGDALVAVSKAYEDGGIDAARDIANAALDGAYGYNLGPVLFSEILGGNTSEFGKGGAAQALLAGTVSCGSVDF